MGGRGFAWRSPRSSQVGGSRQCRVSDKSTRPSYTLRCGSLLGPKLECDRLDLTLRRGPLLSDPLLDDVEKGRGDDRPQCRWTHREKHHP